MRDFSELGVESTRKGFVGDKTTMDAILNVRIAVYDFHIDKSKFKDEPCLWLQITVAEVKNVVFTSGVALQDVLLRLPKDSFPFSTTIVKKGKRYEFT